MRNLPSRKLARHLFLMMTAISIIAGCSDDPARIAPRLALALEQSDVQPGATLRLSVTNREEMVVYVDAESIHLQRRDAGEWRHTSGLESDGLPSIGQAIGIRPGNTRLLTSVLVANMPTGEYRIAFLAYSEDRESLEGVVTSNPFTVSGE